MVLQFSKFIGINSCNFTNIFFSYYDSLRKIKRRNTSNRT